MAPTARPRLPRLLLAALLVLVVLPLALLALLRQNALELASKNPWSRLPVGTRLVFEETTAVGSTATVSSSATPSLGRRVFQVVLVARTALEVTARTETLEGPPASPGLVREEVRLSLAEETTGGVFPREPVTTPWGKTYPGTRRIETLEPASHDVYWVDPALPLFVKRERRTREGLTTTWLREVKTGE